MTDPSATDPFATEPPPAWAAAARQAAAELDLGGALAGLDAVSWARLRDRAAAILTAGGGPLPLDWERALAGTVGRADPDALARDILAHDEADTVLAEKGEVFAPEDDA
ncbi:hypothetical protein MKL09_11970 [Methylobacterium sp. J-048]|uniref:hypothetical protein n=1 Tax=Methylobacterium sp. J-048 TaxID=2836635 RepID=UPI001FBAB761|nr:hypothetical protein [Methylobacterium sp. J-048]MCJ2057271.1 hypothetical protein [Methylobacterium sp. J-048]